MRATLANAALARYAGRFVWLELDFDKPVNQSFIARHGVSFTPTLFVLDPADERATATKFGGLTLSELERFLDQGERGVKERASLPAAAALAHGDELMGRGQRSDAAAAYRDALRLAAPGWPERNHAVGSLITALSAVGEYQACAETAAAEAPTIPRDATFAAIVRVGLGCANGSRPATWGEAAGKILEPLATEALALPSALRDERFQLYQQLIDAAQIRGDKPAVKRWGERWLAEIDATKPADDDERSALDIARVDAADLLEEPARIIPELVASERAMPNNYNASLRLAQMEKEAKRYDDAVAACDRGLAHVTGPLGRTWLMKIKAEALIGKGEKTNARKVLEEALESARRIGNEQIRDRNVRQITEAIAEIDRQR